MEIFIFWLLFSFIVAFVFGTARTIGFWPSLLLSLLLSPLIGFIVCLFYETNDAKASREKSLKLQQEAVQIAKQQANKSQVSAVDELDRLLKLKAENLITEEEYFKLKAKIIS